MALPSTESRDQLILTKNSQFMVTSEYPFWIGVVAVGCPRATFTYGHFPVLENYHNQVRPNIYDLYLQTYNEKG